MSLTRKVAYNTAAQVISRILQTIGGLILLKIVAKYLGVAGVGELTTVFAYVGLVSIFADMGFFLILVREIAKDPQREQELANNVITMRSLFGLALFLIGFAIVWLLSYGNDVKISIGIYSLASFWPIIGGTLAAVFQSHFRIDKAAIGDIVRTLGNLLGVLAAISLNTGLPGIFIGYLIGNFLGFLAQFFLVGRYIKFRPTFNLKIWRRLLIEALPMGFVTILGFIYFKIDTVMLSLMKTPTDVGIYSPAFKILEVMSALPAYFMSAVMPIYASYVANKDPRLKAAFQRSFDLLVIMALPIVVGAFVIAGGLVPLLTTNEFLNASTVAIFGIPATAATALRILVFTCLFLFANHALGYLLIAGGYQRKLIIPYIGFTVFNIVANLILIPKLSYVGASLTTVATEILVFSFSAYLVNKYFKLRPALGRFSRALIASLIMGFVIYSFRDLVFLAIFSGAIVYSLALYLLRGINKNDVWQLIKTS